MDRLITMAHRARSRRSTGAKTRISATIPKSTQFSTQEELQDHWKKQLAEVPNEHYIPALGADGVFSLAMRVQIEQITRLDKSYCLSHGLGYVHMSESHPDYDFGSSESDPTVALSDPRKFNARAWWEFITELRGVTLTGILRDAIDAGDRVLLTIPPYFLTYLLGELTKVAKSGDLNIADIKQCLRIFGNEAEDRVPAGLMDCVMPYDEIADRVVVGTRPTRVRRLAYLLTKVRPDGRDPIDDYKAIWSYISDPTSPVLKYATAPTKAAGSGMAADTLDDNQLKKLIKENYLERCHGRDNRVKRALREDGYKVDPERVTAIVDQLSGKTATKATKSAGGSGEARKSTKQKAKASNADDSASAASATA